MERGIITLTIKNSYDFLSFISFPSSAKIVNDEGAWGRWYLFDRMPVRSGSKVRVIIKGKQEGVLDTVSHVFIDGYDGKAWRRIAVPITYPFGTFNWITLEGETVIPSDVEVILSALAGGSKGTTWIDDAKFYQDDVLIYSDDFSKWDPMIGAGVGAPIGGVAGYLLKEPLGPMVSEVVGAVLGGALGGGVGLLTGLGIIPVPQIPIPALGAVPEGPVAPAQLGKYQITG